MLPNLDIPEFLKISQERRKQAWIEFDQQHNARPRGPCTKRRPQPGDVATVWAERERALSALELAAMPRPPRVR